MTAYLLVVVLLLPPGPGGQPLEHELHREVVGASSQAVCERRAEQQARALRQANAELLARTGGRIAGECRPLNPEPRT